jgi:hypothetical protein
MARFTLTANPDNSRAFFGLSASSIYLCSDEPSNALNGLGVGFDSTDPASGFWSIITRDASVGQRIILNGTQAGGIPAPRNTTDVYDLVIFAKPNAPSVYVRLLNLSRGLTIYNGFLSSPTPLPTAVAPLYVHAEAGVGAGASGAAVFDLYRLDVDSVGDGVYAPPAAQPLHHLVSAAPIGLGIAVRFANGQVEAATSRLHAVPFLGVALETALAAGQTIGVQIAGVLDPAIMTLGAGVACAIGVDINGHLVRATDPACVSAPNWIGHCDVQGHITIAPRRDVHLNVLDFGAAADGAADDTQAIQAALDASMRVIPLDNPLSSGKIVHLPPGDYRITAPLVISNGMELRGAGFGATATVRILADVENGNFNLTTRTGIPDVEGETVYCALALVRPLAGPPMNPARGSAEYCVVSGLQLESSPSQSWLPQITTYYQQPQMDGIRVLAPGCIIEKCGVTAFRRNGITVYAPGSQFVNADITQFRDLTIFRNGLHGIDLHGADSNAILGLNINVTGNGDCGIHDESFLGCTWVACHAEANQRYQYQCATYSSFIGCYAEMDAPSFFAGPVVVEGGNNKTITADSAFIGSVPVAGKGVGAKKWEAYNPSDRIREWPSQGSGYGIKIDKDTKVQYEGYVYQALNGGRTYGSFRGEPAPSFPKTKGAIVTDGTVKWQCLGSLSDPELQNPEPVFASIGSDEEGVVSSFAHYRRKLGEKTGYWKVKNYANPKWRDRFTYVWNGAYSGISFCDYLSQPYPYAFCQPAVHYGSAYRDERSIQAVYAGSGQLPTFSADPSDGILKGALLPGDLFVNARVDAASQTPVGEPWAWRVKKQGGFPKSSWQTETHFFIGDTIRVTVDGIDYIFECSDYVDLADPRNNFTGSSQPVWNAATNYTTSDPGVQGGIKWLCLGPADLAPVFEPLPNQGAPHADSTATDVSGVRADFNALLAKLRAAHIIAP